MVFTVLFYSKFKYDSLGPGQIAWTPETGATSSMS